MTRMMPWTFLWCLGACVLVACGGQEGGEPEEPLYDLDRRADDVGTDAAGHSTDAGGGDAAGSDAGFVDVGGEDAGEAPGPRRQCTGGAMEITRSGGASTNSYRCAGAQCDGGGHCASDQCGGAVALEVGGGARRVEGDQPAHRHTSLPSGAGCDVGGGDFQGVDAHFRLKGVTIGRTLVFDARDSDSPLAFYVMGKCGATSCRAAGVYDEQGDNLVRWTPEAGGEAILMVKSLTEPNRQGFSFEVRPAAE